MQALTLRLPAFVRSDRGKAGWFLPLSAAVHLAVIGAALWVGPTGMTVSPRMPQIDLALVTTEPPAPVPVAEPVKQVTLPTPKQAALARS